MDFKKILLLFYLLHLFSLSFGQSKNHNISENGFVKLPFHYENNFIIIEATVNKMLPLKFIYDTGAQNTIITKKLLIDVLGVPKTKEFKILGSDQTTELIAYLVLGLRFDFHSIVVPFYNVLVLEEDYFKFDETNGINIHGILGADLFRSFIVKIDYNKSVLTLFDPTYYYTKYPDTEWIDIDIHSNRPYITTNTTLSNDTIIKTKYLIDTGASLPLLLNTSTHPLLTIPEKSIPGHIGSGLGGYLKGYTGRVKEIKIGSYVFNNVITHFQKSSHPIDSLKSYRRNGIIGNQILNRFQLTIDFSKEKISLTPNRYYNDAFEYDKSGLLLIAAGSDINIITVQEILPDSPANMSGFKKGDVIKSINYIPTVMLSLSDVNRKLAKKAGKRLRIKIKRGEKTIIKRITLRDLI